MVSSLKGSVVSLSGSGLSRFGTALGLLSLLDRSTPVKLAEQVLVFVTAYQAIASFLFGWVAIWVFEVSQPECNAIVLVAIWQVSFARAMADPGLGFWSTSEFIVVAPFILLLSIILAFFLPSYLTIPILLIYILMMLWQWVRPVPKVGPMSRFQNRIARRIRKEIVWVLALVVGVVLLSAIITVWEW